MEKKIHSVLHPWARTGLDLSEVFKTHVEEGLSEEEAQKRLAAYGENIFREEKHVTPLSIFIQQFRNPLIVVLGIAVILTIVLSKWFDAGIILFAILVNTALGFIQEYKAERAIAGLRSYISERTRVIRGGKEFEIDARFIVPGDIIHLTNGSRITADARLISVTNLSVDEALLTGESLPVSKHTENISETAVLAERKNMVFAGTLVTDGFAYALVTETGYQTEIGRLSRLVAETVSEKTPLQLAIKKLAWVIIIVISVMVAGIFFVGVTQGQPLYDMLLISIAIIVGAVPEALPIGLTAVLAIGVERIARQKGIMRSLTAAETLGSTTLIITDKTGTLTEAHMQLVDVSLLEKIIRKSFRSDAIRSRYSVTEKELLRLAACNSDVVIRNEAEHPSNWDMSGAAIETNIVRSAAYHGIYLTKEERIKTQIRLPFNSQNKFSVSRISPEYLPGAYDKYENPHVVVGAPDILLARAFMDKETYMAAVDATTKLSENGRRVLGVALLTPHTEDEHLRPEHVQNVTFLGVISFYDPIRKEVPDALKHIESHGVRVVMATGDLPGTAASVARAIGWDINEGSILTGEQLRQLTDNELLEALAHVRIVARVTPEDKLRVARLYQARGEIVAMTGDGVNDAPALKASNIGIAVGSGSDVAKSIADLVLLDDNFQTIVSTIEEGKRMLSNIKKIFVYLMSNALDGVILIGGSVLLGVAMPLSALQIIWVNFFTGSIPAIAFAFERQPLQHESKKFFDKPVQILTIGIGILSSLILFILYLCLLAFDIPLVTVQSIIFACFGSYILVVAFSFRNLHKPIYAYSFFGNKPLFFGCLFGLAVLLATIYVPLLQVLFGTSALTLPWLLFVAVWVLCNIVLIELAKYLLRIYIKE